MRCPRCHRRFDAGRCPRDGFEAPARAAAPVPPVVHGLELERLLGEGGGGEVWAARRGGKAFALKVGDTRAHLALEARALTALGPPLTPALVEADLDASRPWLLLERLEGETLAAALGGARAPIGVVDRLANLVALVHARGWCWGDLKPENVWLAPDGALRALDFGLARCLTDAGHAEEHRLVQRAGTPHYMAPELWEGAPVSPASDAYAWAAVAWEVLAGVPPFVGTLADLREGHLHRVPRAPPQLEWLLPFLAKAPARRPAPRSAPSAPVAPVAERPPQRVDAAPTEEEVVLACVPLDELALGARQGATLVRLTDDRALFAFPAQDAVRALDAATPLAAVGVVHLARCIVSNGASGVQVLGAAVDAPERWVSTAHAGWTPEARARIGRLDATLPEVSLVGRAAERDALLEAVRHACDARLPTWCFLAGEPGTGRSRLLDEVARAAAERGAAVVRATRGAAHLHARGRLLVVADDADGLGADALSALESWTLAESARPVAVVAAVEPAFLSRHPGVGERAGRRVVVALPPLPDDAVEELARSLLAPAEFVPAELTRALAASSAGRPLALVRALEGLLRRARLWRDDVSGEWQLAPGVLEELARGAPGAGAWSSLPSDFSRVAVVCAALEEPFDAGAVAAVLAKLPADEALDAEAVLTRLVRLGVLRARGASFGFAQHSTAPALLRSAPPAELERIHRAIVTASGSWTTEAARRRRARANLALGRPAAASEDARFLGEAALAAHRAVEAVEWLTLALDGAEGAARVPLLLSLARALRRRQDFAAALGVLDDAATLAGSPAERRELDLERATCLDWLERYDEAVALGVAVEREVAGGSVAPDAAVLLALGRTALRQGRWQAALERLGAVARGDGELAVVAGALAGAAFAVVGDVSASEASFARAEAQALALGDLVHLGVVLSNRVMLHLKRGDVASAVADLERAVHLSRRAGHATIERWCSHNLAQFHLWGGRAAAALPLARRAHQLAVRFFAPSQPVSSTLLLARALAATGSAQEAHALLACVEPLRARFGAGDVAGWVTARARLGVACTDEELAFLERAPELQPDERFDALHAVSLVRPEARPAAERAAAGATPGLFGVAAAVSV